MADPIWENTAPLQTLASAPTSSAPPTQQTAGGVPTWENTESADDKYGSASQQAIAGVEGLASGATFGGSRVLENKLGLTTPTAQAGRAEVNPITSGLGTIAGGAALIAATGGAGALAEGAGAVAKIGAMAVEGGAFGAGNAVSDYAMGDPNLNAQKVLAQIGTGAALAGGLGLLGKAAEVALPAATQKLTAALGKLKDFAIGDAANPGLINDVAPNWSQKLYDGMASSGRDPNTSIRELVTNLDSIQGTAKKAASDLYDTAAPANIAEALKSMPVDHAQELAEGTLNKINQFSSTVDEAGQSVSALSSGNAKILEQRISTLETSLNDAGSSMEVHDALNQFAKDLDKGKLIKFDTMPTASQMADQEILGRVRDAIRGDLKNSSQWGDAAEHYSQLSKDYADYQNSLKNFRSSFMKREISPSGGKTYAVDPAKVQSFFNNFNDVSQDLKKKYLDSFLNQTKNLAEKSEAYHGYVKGADSLSEQVESLASKHAEMAKVAEAMAGRTKGTGTPFPLGEGAFAVGASSLGIPHPVVGAALAGLEAYKAIANPYETGQALGSAVTKFKALGDIINKASNGLESAAKSVFTSNARGAVYASTQAASDKNYDKTTSRIQDLAGNPQKMMDHMAKSTEALHSVAPNISQGIQTTLMNGLTFLDSKVPKPSSDYALSPDFKPSKTAVAQFNRYYNAVNDPLSVLKNVKQGTLTNEHLEALQAVHPDLYQEMQKSLIANLSKGKNLSTATKISLSKFLGSPVDAGQAPQAVQANQAAYQSAPQASPQQKGKKSSLGGLKSLRLGSRAATATQDNDA